jgi:NADPH:quinone reductase-like Zn-dependent oxidoreductase
VRSHHAVAAGGEGRDASIVQREYDAPEAVLSLREVDVPEPWPDEVPRVHARASSVDPAEWHIVRGTPVLLRATGLGGVSRLVFPFPGGDIAGVVERSGVELRARRRGVRLAPPIRWSKRRPR